MNQKPENGVLLDTNVVIAYVDSNDRHHQAAEDQLRFVALTADSLLIAEPTLLEIRNWIQYESRSPLLTRDKRVALHNLEAFLNNQFVTIIPGGAVQRSELGHELLVRVFKELVDRKPLRNRFAAELDALLVLNSQTCGAPILTLDKALQSIAPAPLAAVELQCPFDAEELRKVTLESIMGLAAPLRAIYRNAFSTLRTQASEIEEARSQGARLDALLRFSTEDKVRQAQRIFELERKIKETTDQEEFWRRAARPNLKQAIGWTLVETALGFLGVPMPTTPLAFLIEIIRYRHQLQRSDRDDNRIGNYQSIKP
jgi:predicted nucleic acid-binding protein